MFPSSKSKAKDMASSKAAKDHQKASSKPCSVPASGGNFQANAYNPLSGTFHTVEATTHGTLLSPMNNGRYRSIDETEDSGSLLGTPVDYDSISNNDSCSGESEDQKEKMVPGTSAQPEAIPGCDSDKRDKIRQKNEKKHQRQRERRAQELHDRCTSIIMSRKLEMLTQQLVAMGFSAERATLALMLNGGRVEDSVSWLFEVGIEDQQTKVPTDGICSMKINISEELAKIIVLEKKFNYSRQEVERAIVACEGDLEKASETLKSQRQELPTTPSKPEAYPPTISGSSKVLSTENPVARLQGRTVVSVGIQQPRRDEKDFNYSKAVAALSAAPESGNINLASTKKGTDVPSAQVATQVEKRWATCASPSVSYSLSSPLQTTASNTEAPCVINCGEDKTNTQTGTTRDIGFMLQRPQSINTKKNPSSPGSNLNKLPSVNIGWNPVTSGTSMSKAVNDSSRKNVSNISQSTSNPNLGNVLYRPNLRQPVFPSSVDSSATGWGVSWANTRTSRGTSPITPTSSLGLFTGWGSSGSSGSSSPVDWSMGGSMPHCDYTNIDWSMESTPLHLNTVPSVKISHIHETRPTTTTYMGESTARPRLGVRVGLQDGCLTMNASSFAGPYEWTSPFAGKDIFRVPRLFVTSPSL